MPRHLLYVCSCAPVSELIAAEECLGVDVDCRLLQRRRQIKVIIDQVCS